MVNASTSRAALVMGRGSCNAPVEVSACTNASTSGFSRCTNSATYHHTASATLFYALHESLRLIHEEGLEERFTRHCRAHQTLVDGFEALGLRMHVPAGYRIPHLNTPRVPEGVDDAKVRKYLLEKNGIEIAGGFGPLAGRSSASG